jgi:hypothetical protein
MEVATSLGSRNVNHTFVAVVASPGRFLVAVVGSAISRLSCFSFGKGAEHMYLVLRLRIDHVRFSKFFQIHGKDHSRGCNHPRSERLALDEGKGISAPGKTFAPFSPAWLQLGSEAARPPAPARDIRDGASERDLDSTFLRAASRARAFLARARRW